MSLVNRIAPSSKRQQRPQIVTPALPAPVGGLVTSQNIGAMQPGTAIVLSNWFPTRTGTAVRGGNRKHATTGTEPVESLMNYVGGNASAIFAGAGGNIYDITSPVDPVTPPAPDVTGQTSNYYSFINFPVTGGNRMPVVNGTDPLQLYDGLTWQAVTGVSVPIAITGVDTSTLIHINAYRNRIYMVESGSLNVWYLPVDSVGGAASVLSLSGVFTKGGVIQFTATWSSESGAASMQAYLVVMSSEGEAAVFSGAFPEADDWSLVNVYDIARPLGKNGWFRAGGDIVIATEMGMVPVSAARYKDPAALGMDAISQKIEPTWKQAAQSRASLPWEIAKWNENDAFYVNTPAIDGQETLTIVGNLTTGAISTYTGWDNRCFGIHNRQMYFGCNDGTVRLAEVGGSDDGMPYTAQAAFAWDHLGSPGWTKSIKQAQAIWNTTRPFAYRLSASTDYRQEFPISPNTLPDTDPASLWDSGLWDSAKWDAGEVQYNVRSRQLSIGRTGLVFSMEVQVPVNGTNTPQIELVSVYHTTVAGGYGV
jgi:hypothetical protein